MQHVFMAMPVLALVLFLFLPWPVALGLYIPIVGVSMELASRRPWESLNKYLRNTTMTELYLGFTYIATGER